MLIQTKSAPVGWLAFELNVLRRLKFGSVASPFTPEPLLGMYLKRHDIRVIANDPLQSSWTRALAFIQNNSEKLTDADVETILEDVYVPGYKLRNPALRTWFSETDAWWFDNIRANLDRLSSPLAFAVGTSLVMSVGDYALSFTEETREIRQPLSKAFQRFRSILPEPVNNGESNSCRNQTIKEFIAESHCDLMFLRLPPSRTTNRLAVSDKSVWREEWLRGGNEFWPAFEASRNGMLGMAVEMKSQYLRLVEETLDIARHIKQWAIAHVETGLISTQEMVDTVARVKNVKAVYTKDFSELTGTKGVIITA